MRYALRVVAVNLLILLVALIGLELAFGHWIHGNRMARLSLRRDFDRRYEIGDLYVSEQQFIDYRRDPFGLRGPYDSLDSIDVLTVGGSTTDQRYVTEGDTWQAVIRDAFRRDGLEVSVVNAGIDGQSSLGHIKNFDWWFPELPDLEVRYYLFYVGLNDLYTHEDYAYEAILRDPPTSLKGQLQENSAIYHLFRTVRGIYRAEKLANAGHRRVRREDLEWTHVPRLSNHRAVMDERLAAYRTRLAQLIERVRAVGAVPIFVTQPSRHSRTVAGRTEGTTAVTQWGPHEINGLDHSLLMEIINDTTLEVAREFGELAFDLAREVSLEDADYYDYTHNTPSGARKIGSYLHEKLTPLMAR